MHTRMPVKPAIRMPCNMSHMSMCCIAHLTHTAGPLNQGHGALANPHNSCSPSCAAHATCRRASRRSNA